MKIVKNSIVSICLVFALMLSSVMFVDASNTLYKGENTSKSAMDEYALEQIEIYLKAPMYNVSADYVSQAFEVYDVDEACVSSRYVYFVLSGDEIVGHLYVNDENGEFFSSYVNGPYDIPVGAGDDVLFYSYNRELVLRCELSDIHFGGERNSSHLEVEIPLLYQSIVKMFDVSVVNGVNSRMTYYYLAPPYVANSTVNGIGICWAACIASRVNYHKGYSLTAMDVFNACNAAGTNRPSGTPEGNDVWIQYGFALYDINTTYILGGKNFGQICSLLASDIPISCAFENSTTCHEVLLIGVYQDGSSNVYMFMDPNENGVVSVNQSADALTDYTKVYYAQGTSYYPTWHRSIY